MKKLGLALLATSLFLVTGCDFKGFTISPQGESQKTANEPVIQVFTSNPSSGGTWDQSFTFSVEATSPGQTLLKYNWSATKGTLTSTTGKLISWQPPKEAGTFSVQVSVIDTVTGGQAVAAANITISNEGSVTVVK